MLAEFSNCKKHRFKLERHLEGKSCVVAFFGVNPSTADSVNNDSTVKKWIVFANRLNAHKLIVGNMFSYITPYIKELATCGEVTNIKNEQALDSIFVMQIFLLHAGVLEQKYEQYCALILINLWIS